MSTTIIQAQPTPNRVGVYPGRYSAENQHDLVVFLIGMRFNSLRGLPSAIQVFFKMPKMLAALYRDPQKGFISGRVMFGAQTITFVQYWRSYEDLERFARAPDGEHVPAWRWFNRLGHAGHGVGVWHETYRVAAGSYESIYANMPRFGLAEAMGHRAIKPVEATIAAEHRVRGA